jgi:peptidoglycan/LPS O-acetylase OafA/YrhL
MKPGNGVYSLIKTISMIAGSIALIGMVVGLYFKILPERNILIRYAEIGFFSLCIPVLIGEVWQRLRKIKCTIMHLKLILGIFSIGLMVLLYHAYQIGGILTYEFTAVVVLTIMVIVLTSVGAKSIKRALFRIRPLYSSA